MNSEQPPLALPRRMAWAALLSLLGAGIGHIYAGRGRRGVILLALSLLWAPLALFLSHAQPAMWVLYTLLGAMLLTLGVSLFAIVDSVFAARKAARPYVPKTYNLPGLYLGLALLSMMWFFVAAHFVRNHSFRAYKIPTRSMEPGVQFNERILVNMRMRSPKRGDLIVFPAPDRPKVTFFKRVVGLPGETITFENGLVHVDGRPLANRQTADDAYEEDAGGRTYAITRGAEGTTVPSDDVAAAVPAGHVYVLGDHRPSSRDSRAFGTIPISSVKGTAQYVFFKRVDVLR